MTETNTTIQLVGAFCFGALIGWFTYYINRFRKTDVQWSDLATLIGILGGGAVLALFPSQTDLFGAYGTGLFAGFFGYFCFLNIWVRISKDFTVEYFLDGRRSVPRELVTGVSRDGPSHLTIVPGIETRTVYGSAVVPEGRAAMEGDTSAGFED